MSSELTLGELRFVEESLNVWKQYVYEIKDLMDEFPPELSKHLRELSDRYKEEFKKYYMAEKEKNPNVTSDAALAAFDAGWDDVCPEFYDVKALFSSCSAADLEKASAAIEEAVNAFKLQ